MSGKLHLDLLGTPRVSLGGEPVSGFVSSKALALLCYLAVERGMHSREDLAGLLWGETPDTDARASLRVVLSNLRQVLGPGRLEITRQAVGFNRSGEYWLDVEAFEKHAGNDAPLQDDTVDGLRDATRLYRGDLLDGLGVRHAPAFDEWLVMRREHLRRLASQALYIQAVYDTNTGRYTEGIECISRALALDPWREDAHRQLMILLVYSGQRGAALAQYEYCRQLLADELGAEPEPETIALFEQIRAGTIDAGNPSGRRQQQRVPLSVERSPGRSGAHHTVFVGRESELAQLADRIRNSACRLVSVVGPGGIGKSRLALRAADDLGGEFTDGAWVVPLASVSSPEYIVPAIAGVLGIALVGPGDPTDQLLRELRNAEMLLILDNFEHLMDGALLLNEILDSLPGVKVVVTTRERLALAAEWLIAISGLPLPAGTGIDDMAASPAVRLFVERARQSRPESELTDDDLASIARICAMLEGMPLGIELAAGWMRTHSCAEIEAEIRSGFDFLFTEGRDIPERHRSLRAVFDRSWVLLSEDQREAFQALSVFRGGFTGPAAGAVAGASLADLASLVDKSILRRETSGRYTMHQLVRQYAAEQLAVSADAGSARSRHARFFTKLLEDAAPALRGAGQEEALHVIGSEIGNVRAAWDWIIEHHEFTLIARALDGLCLFYDLRGWLREAQAELDLAVAALGTPAVARENTIAVREIVTGRLLGWQGRIANMLGRFEESEALIEQSLTLLRRHDAEDELAYGLDTQGMNANARGEQDEAARLQTSALAAATAAADRLGVSLALNRLGGIAFDSGDFPTAQKWFKQSLSARRRMRDWQGIARDVSNLGEVARLLGNFTESRRRSEDSLALFRELGDNWRMVLPLENLGELSRCEGHLDEAEQYFQRALALVRDTGEKRHLTISLLGLARVAAWRGQVEPARELVAESLALSRENGIRQGIVECLNVQSKLVQQSGDWEASLRVARECLALACEVGNQYGMGLAELLVGQAATALGRHSEAANSFAAAFARLQRCGARPAILEAMSCIAELLLLSGEAREILDCDEGLLPAAEQVAEWSEFARRYPAAWYETRVKCDSLSLQTDLRLPSHEATAARKRSETLTLDGLIAQVLSVSGQLSEALVQ